MKWNSFIKELSNIIFFWFFGILFFLIFRLSFIIFFHKKISVLEFIDFIKTLNMGARFDGTAIGYFLIPPLLALFIFAPLNKIKVAVIVRRICQVLFVIFSTIICLVTINYFIEYDNQFNSLLFLGLYDDRAAVMKTIMKDFNPIVNILVMVGVIIISLFILKYFEKKEFIYSILSKIKKTPYKVLFIIIFLGLFFVGIRGSFTEFPAKRFIAGVSKDKFLNKTIINPFRSLKYAFEDFEEFNSNQNNPFLKPEEFHKLYPQDSVRQILRKHTQGNIIEKPKQIFLIVMESYDSWPLMDKYLPLGLSKNLKTIADKGIRFPNFLPASYSTFNSYASIIINVPYMGYNVSHIREQYDPLCTSIFEQFKKLGYKTNLFYGGFLSWENLGDFSLYQGCDNVYSGIESSKDNATNVWGVDDENLFDLVLEKTNKDEYSFNVILTTSYHPPYTVDIYKKGFPYKKKEDFPKEMQQYVDNGIPLKELGHLWYSDKCIGDFVKVAEKKYPNSLFGFTGDHYGRRFITHQPNLYEHSSVNFILYGNGISPSVNKTLGTHIDIMPTLIEMIAPKDFEYYSFGKPLLIPNNNPKGIAFEKIIIDNKILFFPTGNNKRYQITLDNMIESEMTDFDKYSKLYNDFMGLAWHYTLKGDKIEKENISIAK